MRISPRHQVIVVGAGLAGLVAARRLVALGLDVMVVEARERVGGRVWSHRLPNGEIVELGGEWISTTQTAVIDLAGELGLGLVETGMDFASRDPVGGPPISAEEHDRLSRAVFERMQRLGESALGEMTAEELLDSIDESGPAMTVLRSRLGGTAGAALGEVAAGEIGEEFGIGDPGSYVRIDGGNDRLAGRIAAELDVRLEQPVTSIHQEPDGVDVVVRNTVFQAEAVVLAIPLGVLKRLVLDPEPPGPMVDVLSRLQMGAGAKVAVATIDGPPMFRRQDVDIPAWYWTGLGPEGRVRKAITGFAGSGEGVAILVSEARLRLARAAQESTLAGQPIVVDWTSEVFSGGCYSVIGPGQRPLLDVLSRPWGRVVLAGEHVNGTGTIEGAILSGEDAARRMFGSIVF